VFATGQGRKTEVTDAPPSPSYAPGLRAGTYGEPLAVLRLMVDGIKRGRCRS
jgi:hypothetical protein